MANMFDNDWPQASDLTLINERKYIQPCPQERVYYYACHIDNEWPKFLVCRRSHLSTGISYQAKTLAELTEILPSCMLFNGSQVRRAEKKPDLVISINSDPNHP